MNINQASGEGVAGPPNVLMGQHCRPLADMGGREALEMRWKFGNTQTDI